MYDINWQPKARKQVGKIVDSATRSEIAAAAGLPTSEGADQP